MPDNKKDFLHYVLRKEKPYLAFSIFMLLLLPTLVFGMYGTPFSWVSAIAIELGVGFGVLSGFYEIRQNWLEKWEQGLMCRE